MARLTLSLLGPFRVTIDNQVINHFAYDKVRALLAYLAVESDSAHSRDVLAALLWPDLPNSAARTNLRQALTTLRQAIDDLNAQPPVLLITRETIQFNVACDHALDVTTFQLLLGTCATHPHRRSDTCSSCCRRRAEALALYRGAFLAELFLADSAAFEEWAVLRREHLHAQVRAALAGVTAYYERRASYEDAQRYARRLVELEPWNEEAHQQLMWVLWLDGQRSAALAHYRQCCDLLQAELGIEPAPETTALYERIRTGPPRTSMARHVQGSPAPTLAAATTPLLGRDHDLAQLADLLEQRDCRLLTLVGTGGVGKTRLALQLAADVAWSFADGVTFVALEAITDPALVPATIARVLGVTERSDQPLLDRLTSMLRERELLLVLDNFEQVLAAAPAVATLLRNAPGLTVLVTSRAVLKVHAEQVFPVPPLATPDRRHWSRLAVLAQVPAVALFLRRAQAVSPVFHLTDRNAPAIAEICTRLDGLPLALELAAARTTLFAPHALLARLDNRLHTLTGGARDLPGRQQTLRFAIDWSYVLLPADQQELFRQLAVFSGGWTVAAVEAVSADDARQLDVLDGLQSLLEQSLLQPMAGPDGEPRFTMLETIREYALQCLVASGERERVGQRHAAYFLTLAEEAAAALQGPQQLTWLARLEVEHDNLRVVLAWSTREQDALAGLRRATGLRVADALSAFWERRGHLAEGRAWLDRLLSEVERDDAVEPAPAEELVANAVSAAARLAYMHGDLPAARRLYDRSLVWHTKHHNPRGRAVALVGLGHIAAAYDDLRGARMHYQEAVTMRRELDDIRGGCSVVFSLGHIAMSLGELDEAAARFAETIALDHELGDMAGLALDYDAAGQLAFLQCRYDEARAQTEMALALYRQLGDTTKVAEALDVLGWLEVQHGEYSRAATLLVEAVSLARNVDGNKTVLAWPLCRLGIVATRQQDAVRACSLLRESLALFTACQPPETAGISLCLLGFASLAGGHKQPEQSARLVGIAAALHEAGNLWCRGFAQREIERTITAARAGLDEVAWAAAWAAGRAMTVEQAVAEALSVTS